ncbi:nucleotidyltransferase family protein [uncultured Imperialibacter sp.]|uniref:nucleotidyltransferase family protein n=1 Tax=uncultured Imperialibacter sp. TaxID=1672639 RepID=UPI0030D8BE0E|tara:strand:+ start:22134 stop:22436 length:303 start_codon:yes stop_codon:yes gene_type:complete
MKLSSHHILEFITTHQPEIERFGVSKLGLFGSFVRNEQTPESDIDILVEYKPGTKSFDNFIGLIDYLENSLGRNIELVTPESLSPLIRPYIEKEIQYVQF